MFALIEVLVAAIQKSVFPIEVRNGARRPRSREYYLKVCEGTAAALWAAGFIEKDMLEPNNDRIRGVNFDFGTDEQKEVVFIDVLVSPGFNGVSSMCGHTRIGQHRKPRFELLTQVAQSN